MLLTPNSPYRKTYARVLPSSIMALSHNTNLNKPTHNEIHRDHALPLLVWHGLV